MLLFTVTEAFTITGRGVVLAPGLAGNARSVKTGGKIRLVRPDKTELTTTIQGIAFNDQQNILVGPEVVRSDVPVGTEVWLEE